MSLSDSLDDCLDLLRRLPPQNVQTNLTKLVDLVPSIADDLLASVDQPLLVMKDEFDPNSAEAGEEEIDPEGEEPGRGREYLVCDYNKDGESYRSPWSNAYSPPLPDGTRPSPSLRKLEIAANEAFDVYRDMYYEGGVSSVYLWDLDDGGFAGVVLMKKVSPPPGEGSWDSIHVFESSSRAGARAAHYKLTSTVMLHIARHAPKLSGKAQKPIGGGEKEAEWETGRDEGLTLSGSLTRQIEQDAPLDPPTQTSHIPNIGRMIEDMEIKMRNLLQDVYFSKTKDVVNDLRSIQGLAARSQRAALQGELVGMLRGRSGGNSGSGERSS